MIKREETTALMKAAQAGHTAIVGFLIEHGARLEHRDSQGRRAWEWALQMGRNATAIALLDAGTTLSTNDDGWTPLHAAAGHGMTELTSRLLADGWDIEAPAEKVQVTPLGTAAHAGHPAVVRLLLEKGASPNPAVTEGGGTPSGFAVRGRAKTCPECAAILLAAGANRMIGDVDVAELARTPEMIAALGGDAAGTRRGRLQRSSPWRERGKVPTRSSRG